jgi:hypothetical protein
MFTIITLLSLAGLILGLTVHNFRAVRTERDGRDISAFLGWLGAAAGSGIKKIPRLGLSAIPSLYRRLPGTWTAFEKLLAAGLALSFLYLALSGLIFALIPGRSLFGVFLVLHVMLGGLFALCLTLLVLFRAGDFVFTSPDDGTPLLQEKVAWKAMFWIFSAAGAALTATALMPMLPLLSHTGQLLAVSIHRFSALAALLSFITFVYFGIQSQEE